MKDLKSVANEFVHRQLTSNFKISRCLKELLKSYAELLEIARPDMDDNLAMYHFEQFSKGFDAIASLDKDYGDELADSYEQALASSIPVIPLNVVYLVRRNDGLHKIGCTTSAESRFRALKKEHGKIDVIHIIYCKDHYGVEKKLHREFAEKRVRGEWFNLNTVDIEYVKSYKV